MGRNFLRHFAIGLCCVALLIPPPAQAQFFGGIVFDPRAYALDVKKGIDEATRWVKTVQHHTETYTKAVEQLTTLRGVLKTVDKQLFKNQQAALLANDIGKILNDSQKLKRRLEGMLRARIRTLKSIDDRLEQGIFDPDADMRDLQAYLLYTMGRDARQTVDKMLRTARADAQLAAWMDERDKLEAQVAPLAKALDKNYETLNQEKGQAPDDQRNINNLNEIVLGQEKLLTDLQIKIKELTNKINERLKDYGLRLQDMENFAHQVNASNEMWRELQKTKVEMQQTLDSLITGAATQSTPR